MAPKGVVARKPQGQAYKDKTKPADVRASNINAAKGEIFQQIKCKLVCTSCLL